MAAPGVRAFVDPTRLGRPAGVHRLLNPRALVDRLRPGACWSWPRTARCRFSSASSSARSPRRTSTSSSPCGWPSSTSRPRAASIAATPDGADARAGRSPTRETSIVALQAAQDALWRDELRPALAAARIRISTPEQCRPREAAGTHEALRARGAPAADAHCARPVGAVLPRPLARAQRGNAGRGRGRHPSPSDERPTGGPPASRGRRTRRAGGRSRTRSSTSCPPSSAAEPCSSTSCSVRRATPTCRSRATQTISSRRSRSSSGAAGSETSSGSRSEAGVSPEIRDVLTRELAIEPARVYETSAPLGLAALMEIAAAERPDLQRPPWRPVTTQQFATVGDRRSCRDPAARPSGAPSVRRVRHERRAVHRVVARPESGGAQDDRVPHRGAVGHALVARRRGRGRQAGGLSRRAARPPPPPASTSVTTSSGRVRSDRAGVQVVHGVPGLKIHAKAVPARTPRAGRPAPLRSTSAAATTTRRTRRPTRT